MLDYFNWHFTEPVELFNVWCPTKGSTHTSTNQRILRAVLSMYDLSVDTRRQALKTLENTLTTSQPRYKLK